MELIDLLRVEISGKGLKKPSIKTLRKLGLAVFYFDIQNQFLKSKL